MAKIFDGIDDHLREWITRQRLFFVGTAPLADDGHVNVSPKGPIESLALLDEHTVAYLDVIGSGAETIAHIRENGRIVVMLCAFEGPPRIVRLHGRGEVVLADDPQFAELFERCGFDGDVLAQRGIVRVEVSRVADSCGYGVPLMSYEGQRPHQRLSSEKRLRVHGPTAFADYQRAKNAESIDGLPAVEV
jgi:predicted pyridoxine 5'-phosphate oxidase superfamily flavin-nucleotide-binding protein